LINFYIFIRVPRTAGTSISEYLNQFRKIDHKPTIFTFLRNPIDRFISSFYFLKKLKNYNGINFRKEQSEYIKQFNSIEEFIEKFGYKGMSYFESQKKLTKDKPINFWGIFEDLDKDFDNLCSILGCPKTNLPIKNSSNKEFINQETRDILKKILNEDIEYYNEIKSKKEFF
jgi:hypothetical protein